MRPKAFYWLNGFWVKTCASISYLTWSRSVFVLLDWFDPFLVFCWLVLWSKEMVSGAGNTHRCIDYTLLTWPTAHEGPWNKCFCISRHLELNSISLHSYENRNAIEHWAKSCLAFWHLTHKDLEKGETSIRVSCTCWVSTIVVSSIQVGLKPSSKCIWKCLSASLKIQCSERTRTQIKM